MRIKLMMLMSTYMLWFARALVVHALYAGGKLVENGGSFSYDDPLASKARL